MSEGRRVYRWSVMSGLSFLLVITASCSRSDADGMPENPVSGSPSISPVEVLPTGSTKTDGSTVIVGSSLGGESGILVGQYSTGIITLGIIDPFSGAYSRYREFDTTKIGRGSPDFKLGLSPDFSKLAVSTKVNGLGHAGWIDESGDFTDVNLNENLDPFGGNQNNQSVGFDAQGNFYYTRLNEDGGKDVMRVRDGKAANAEFVLSEGIAPALPYRTSDGGISFDNFSCFGTAYDIDFVSSTVYLTAVGKQIFKAAVANVEGFGSCGDGDGVPILPSSNNVAVSSPLASPTGDKVSFVHGGRDLYIVDSEGKTPPTKLPVQGLDIGRTAFIDWI